MLMTCSKWITAFALIALAAMAHAATTADVLVRPTTEVMSWDVKLADMAAINCPDEGLAAELGQTSVCPAPLAGRTHNISRGQIITALRRHGLAEAANVLSPDQVSVTRRASAIAGETIVETVRKFVLDREIQPGAVVEVEPVRVPSHQTVPAGVTEIRVAERVQKVRKGRNSIPIEVVVDGRACARISVSVNVRVFGQILVASKQISKLEPVTTQNTTVQDQEITCLPDDVLCELPDGELVAAASIAEGAQIRRNQVSEPPVIRSGDTVTVAAVGGSVRVTDKGTAVSDGRPGEQIKIRMGTAARELRGVVAGPGLVEIQIGRRS